MISDIVLIAIEASILIILLLIIGRAINAGIKLLATLIGKGESLRLTRFLHRLNVIILVLGVILFLGVIGVNSYIVYYLGEDLQQFQLDLLQKIPQDFWVATAVAITKCIALLLLVKLLQEPIQAALKRLSLQVQNYDQIQGNDESIDKFFAFSGRVIASALWLGAAVLCTQFLGLPSVWTGIFAWILATFLTICLGLSFIKATPVIIDTFDELLIRHQDGNRILHFYSEFRHLLPLLRRCIELTIYLTIASVVIGYTQPIAWLTEYVHAVVRLIGIYFLARALIELASVLVDEFVRRSDGLDETQKQRRMTLAPLFKSSCKYLIYFGAMISALNVINIDPTPILAGAGILGVAVGFGAQSLVEDIVSGFLILLENYYLVGDYIQAGRMEERPVEGFVEAIELRTTQLRHPDGQLQIIRNGEVGSIVNYSKQYIYATVDVPLTYTANLDKAYAVLEGVGAKIQEQHADIVLDPTQVEGIEHLGGSLVLVRTITKVKPGQHLYIQRLMRKQLKEAFELADIELADYDLKENDEE